MSGYAQTTSDDRPVADLSVSLSLPSTVGPGQLSPYEIDVTNQGPEDALGITVEFVLPGVQNSLGRIDAGGPGWSCDGIRGTCSLGRLPAGSTSHVEGRWQAPDVLGRVADTHGSPYAEVSATGTSDPVVGNNLSHAEVSVLDSGRKAHLVGDFQTPEIIPGELHPLLHDVIRITNQGPDLVEGVVVIVPSDAVEKIGGPGWSCATSAVANRSVCVFDRPLSAGSFTSLDRLADARPNSRSARIFFLKPVGAIDPNGTDFPAMAPDIIIPPSELRRQDFVKILLPIATKDILGSFGSLFRTEVRLFNGATENLLLNSDYLSTLYLANCGKGHCDLPVDVSPQSTAPLIVNAPAERPGSLLYIRRPFNDTKEVSIRVMDVSRERITAETEIPVIREDAFRTQKLNLINIPGDSRYRIALRIYGPDGEDNERVRVRLYSGVGRSAIGEHVLNLQNPSPDTTGMASLLLGLSYVQVLSLTTDFPEVAGFDPIRIEIEPMSPTLRFWAFVTVTNNVTQQLTTVSPQ